MKLTYLGHSALYIETQNHRLIIDPFIEGNPLCPVHCQDLEVDFVVLTHAHSDHFGNTLDFAHRGATVIGAYEIGIYAGEHGATQVHGMNPGGGFDFPFGRLEYTLAFHSSSFADGRYGGLAMGVLLHIDGHTIYHAGDTALFGDMQHIGRKNLDFAFLPIGDNFTMGPRDALEALELLKPKQVIPIHYNTFPIIKQDAHKFVGDAEALGYSGRVLNPGDNIETKTQYAGT